MSLNLPSRRAFVAASHGLRPASSATAHLPQAAVLTLRPRTRAPTIARAVHTTAPRQISWRGLFGRNKKKADAPSSSDALAGNVSRGDTRQALKDRMTNPQLGASPFLSEMEGAATPTPAAEAESGSGKKRGREQGISGHRNDFGTSMAPEHLKRALDPDPRSRVRWERKMVVRHVERLLDPKGAETRAERLARTERELLHKSTPLPTSTKKLMHLARQIAGKTLEDAILQMRFSKKKMAREVLWHLEEARDTAIVERGMGLGLSSSSSSPLSSSSPDASTGHAAVAPLQIQTKDGRWLSITDPSRIYVDQAWVGKGQWRTAAPDYRARGRRFIKWSPSTFLSVVLKEENTRIRQHKERLDQEAKRAPWVHLPNRPVTAQRPYYSW